MEIERKFVPVKLPDNLESYPHTRIEQGYLCTAPVVRVRRDGWFLLYDIQRRWHDGSWGYNLPLTKEAYEHLIVKADGTVISKTRYRIPIGNDLTAELDIFDGAFKRCTALEVEFLMNLLPEALFLQNGLARM